jgi:hypothetical protein
MKLPRRSLAFGWAKLRLGEKMPKWAPFVFAVSAASVLAFGFWKGEDLSFFIFFSLALLYGGFRAWERIGQQEVIEDFERLLEEAEAKKAPDK